MGSSWLVLERICTKKAKGPKGKHLFISMLNIFLLSRQNQSYFRHDMQTVEHGKEIINKKSLKNNEPIICLQILNCHTALFKAKKDYRAVFSSYDHIVWTFKLIDCARGVSVSVCVLFVCAQMHKIMLCKRIQSSA